jgi:steroid delta-isomerase
MTSLSRTDLENHAAAWITAWNRHDVDAVIAPFSTAALFVSPRAAIVTGEARVRGRDALYDYWTKALAAVPDLKFTGESVVCDEKAQTVLVHYLAHVGGRTVRACELMRFENGLQVYGEAFYGADAPEPTP